MNVSFKAKYISSPTIKKKSLLGKNFNDCKVNFVQLLPEDLYAIKCAAKKWKDKMSANIAFDAYMYFTAKQHSYGIQNFFAIIKKNCNIKKLKPNDILSMISVSYCNEFPDKIINFLSVNPKYTYIKKSRKLKHIGRATLDETKNIYSHEKIKLTSLKDCIQFYKKCGYEEDYEGINTMTLTN